MKTKIMDDCELDRTISLWEENNRKCVVLKNLQTGKIYSFIVRHNFVVGRVPDRCDLQITTDDRYMSGRHLRFINEEGVISIEDLHTKNGTRLNGREVTEKTRISKGDILRMGHSEFVISFQ